MEKSMKDVLELVAQAKDGKFDRQDLTITSLGKKYDVSVYRMTDALVRIDFKNPKQPKSKKGIK